MNRRRLLKRLAEGVLKNVSFSDFTNLVEGFGFRLTRVTGSHHIFAHPNIPELANLQEVKGETKHVHGVRPLQRVLKNSFSGAFGLPVILSEAKNLNVLKEILRRLRLLRMTTESFSTVCFNLYNLGGLQPEH